MISSAAVFVKLLAGAGLGESAIGAWRCIFGASILFPVSIIAGAPRFPPRAVLVFAVLAGFFFALDLYVWHRSIVIVGAGMATILANTQVFWTTLIARFLFGASVRPKFILAVLLAFVGVVLLVGIGSEVEFSARYNLGVAFGLATGLAYSGYVLTIQRAAVLQAKHPLVRSVPPLARSMSVLAWSSAVTAVLLSVASSVEGERFVPSDTQTLGLLFGIGLVPQVLGWIAITGGLQRVPAARGGLVLLVQPILATVWGVLIFDETLFAVQVLGAVLTLAAVYGGSISRE